MSRLLRLPKLAADTDDALLSAWAVSDGTEFNTGTVLATIETSKAAVDIEAESAGILLRALVVAGTDVAIGAPIALIGDPGEEIADLDAEIARLSNQATGPGAAAHKTKTDLALDVPEADTSSATPLPPSEQVEAPHPAYPETRHRTFASPLARRLAHQAHIPIEQIEATGPHERVIRRDVEAAINRRRDLDKSQDADTLTGDTTRDEPHSRLRRAVADRLVRSKRDAPHFYLRAVPEVDRLLALRAELNCGDGPRITITDLIVKAAAVAHQLVPAMNVIWTDEAIRHFDSVDIALAVNTDRGLLTPVINRVQDQSIAALASRTAQAIDRARAGALTQSELEGGTLTITNLGMFGVDEFAAVINPPHAAILAVGVVRAEPVIHDGAIAIATVMRLTLSVDHRPVDGAVAAAWLSELVTCLEHPARILR